MERLTKQKEETRRSSWSEVSEGKRPAFQRTPRTGMPMIVKRYCRYKAWKAGDWVWVPQQQGVEGEGTLRGGGDLRVGHHRGDRAYQQRVQLPGGDRAHQHRDRDRKYLDLEMIGLNVEMVNLAVISLYRREDSFKSCWIMTCGAGKNEGVGVTRSGLTKVAGREAWRLNELGRSLAKAPNYPEHRFLIRIKCFEFRVGKVANHLFVCDFLRTEIKLEKPKRNSIETQKKQ